jgi:hypothetical protein
MDSGQQDPRFKIVDKRIDKKPGKPFYISYIVDKTPEIFMTYNSEEVKGLKTRSNKVFVTKFEENFESIIDLVEKNISTIAVVWIPECGPEYFKGTIDDKFGPDHSIMTLAEFWNRMNGTLNPSVDYYEKYWKYTVPTDFNCPLLGNEAHVFKNSNKRSQITKTKDWAPSMSVEYPEQTSIDSIFQERSIFLIWPDREAIKEITMNNYYKVGEILPTDYKVGFEITENWKNDTEDLDDKVKQLIGFPRLHIHFLDIQKDPAVKNDEKEKPVADLDKFQIDEHVLDMEVLSLKLTNFTFQQDPNTNVLNDTEQVGKIQHDISNLEGKIDSLITDISLETDKQLKIGLTSHIYSMIVELYMYKFYYHSLITTNETYRKIYDLFQDTQNDQITKYFRALPFFGALHEDEIQSFVTKAKEDISVLQQFIKDYYYKTLNTQSADRFIVGIPEGLSYLEVIDYYLRTINEFAKFLITYNLHCGALIENDFFVLNYTEIIDFMTFENVESIMVRNIQNVKTLYNTFINTKQNEDFQTFLFSLVDLYTIHYFIGNVTNTKIIQYVTEIKFHNSILNSFLSDDVFVTNTLTKYIDESLMFANNEFEKLSSNSIHYYSYINIISNLMYYKELLKESALGHTDSRSYLFAIFVKVYSINIQTGHETQFLQQNEQENNVNASEGGSPKLNSWNYNYERILNNTDMSKIHIASALDSLHRYCKIYFMLIEQGESAKISYSYPAKSKSILEQYYNKHFVFIPHKEIVTSTISKQIVPLDHMSIAPLPAAASGGRNRVNRNGGGWDDAFPNIGKGGNGDGSLRFEKPLVGAIMATITALCAIAGGLLT